MIMIELYKALEKEYKILKIFEVWHYDNFEQYHPTKKPDGYSFTQYVDNIMKMKLVNQRASGEQLPMPPQASQRKAINT
uniref:Uncharacterized protein n=1 Tax=Romanomermis culicivorax TaxID=13658 RepID=A0A915JXP0_ROMCU